MHVKILRRTVCDENRTRSAVLCKGQPEIPVMTQANNPFPIYVYIYIYL